MSTRPGNPQCARQAPSANGVALLGGVLQGCEGGDRRGETCMGGRLPKGHMALCALQLEVAVQRVQRPPYGL